MEGGPGTAEARIDTFDPVAIILATCAGLYAVAVSADWRAVLEPASMMALGAPSNRALYLLGMTGGPPWECGQWWTVLTASFLHGGLFHLVFNALWIRSLGPTTAANFGPARFFVIYMLSGTGGFLVSNLASGLPTIGASASIFGLLGALIGLGLRHGVRVSKRVSANVLSLAVILFLLGFAMDGVNNLAHAGGCFTGFGLAFLLPEQQAHREGGAVRALAILLLFALGLGFGMSLWRNWGFYAQGLPMC